MSQCDWPPVLGRKPLLHRHKIPVSLGKSRMGGHRCGRFRERGPEQLQVYLLLYLGFLFNQMNPWLKNSETLSIMTQFSRDEVKQRIWENEKDKLVTFQCCSAWRTRGKTDVFQWRLCFQYEDAKRWDTYSFHFFLLVKKQNKTKTTEIRAQCRQ